MLTANLKFTNKKIFLFFSSLQRFLLSTNIQENFLPEVNMLIMCRLNIKNVVNWREIQTLHCSK
jgi:hypothetical protein